MKLVRMQDDEGRGPWRPGFSRVWMTDKTPKIGAPIFMDRRLLSVVGKAHADGLHIGCAVRLDKISLWFTPQDVERLSSLGFFLVDASRCKVLLETDQQALVGWRKPLKKLPLASCVFRGHEEGEKNDYQ